VGEDNKPVVDDFTSEVFFDCLESAKAWETLHNPEVSGNLTADGLYELMLAAGWSEQAAQKAGTRRAVERQREGLPI